MQIDMKVWKSTKQQEGRKHASATVRQKKERSILSTLNHEQAPHVDFDSSSGNENKSDSRGCCKRCGTRMLQTTHIDTTSSAEELSASIEESGNDAKEDVDSFIKLCPCVTTGSHSNGSDLLMQKRQQLQRPRPKHLYHKHTVLTACFTFPQKQSGAETSTSSLDLQRHECRIETSTEPANMRHAFSHLVSKNPQEASLKAANLNVRLPQPTANCLVTPNNTTTPKRLDGHATIEHAAAKDTNSTAAVGTGSNSLPPINCSARRKHQTNHFEKRLPFYLALQHSPPHRVEAC